VDPTTQRSSITCGCHGKITGMTERVTRRDVPLGAAAASMTPIPPINGVINGIGTAAPIGNWGAASYGLPRPRLPRCMKALGDFKLFGEMRLHARERR
jgi:hypothetical protein